MSAADEYIANLGIDITGLTEVESAISLVGALGDKFPQAAKQASAFETAIGRAGGASGTAAKQTQQLSQSADKSSQSLPRLRYALYDVSFAAAVAGTALAATGIAVEGTAIKYETAFASVARTTTDTAGKSHAALAQMELDLEQLTTTIPSSFEDITNIATLGNQLNIPAAALTSFTKTVAEFAAVTNVSTDAAATDFGRLGQLLGTTNYKEIGDDIAYLGVKAVATESQIAAVAQQIAVSTNAAGFGVGPTLALATALASLGIKPEQARGSLLRTFSDINAAVKSGGTQLNDLAAISGTSSDQFAKDWKDDANGAFIQFVTGLGKNTDDLKSNLASIGISSIRDQQTLGLLAQNVNVLTDANKNLASSNGFLDKSFATVTATTSSQLTILNNDVQRFFNTIGSGTNDGVNVLVRGLQQIINFANQIEQDPLAAYGVGISVVFVTLAGAALLVVAGFLRLAATAAAIRTATGGATSGSLLLTDAWNVLVGKGNALASTNAKVAVTTDGVAVAQRGAAAAAATSAEAQVGSTVATDASTAAAGKLSGVLGKAGLIGSLLALLPLLPSIADAFQNLVGTWNGTISDADTLQTKIEGLTGAAKKLNEQDIAKLLNPTKSQNAAFDGQYNTDPLGAGDPAKTTHQITGPQAYYNKVTTGQTVPGQNLNILQGGDSVNAAESAAEKNIKDYDAALAALVNGGNLKGAQAGIKLFEQNMASQNLTTKQADSLLIQTNGALGVHANSSTAAAAAAKALAGSTDDANSAFADLTDAAFGADNAQAKLQSDLGALGSAFATNGKQAASSGSEIQAVIQDIYASSGGGPAAASQLQGFFDALVKGGYASASQLADLQGVIDGLTGGKGTKAATFSLNSLTGAFDKTSDAAKKTAQNVGGGGGGGGGGAAAAIRTLVDYANDLTQVLTRAASIRYAPQQGLDAISTGWQAIQDNTAAAEKNIQQYQASLDKLTADKAVNEYFLSVANAAGDTLRAGELNATIAQNNSDIADATNSLSDAQSAASKSTTGNSKAAIANRAALIALIGNYNTYIASLASSGKSQAAISKAVEKAKADFEAQARSLGFSQATIDKYSKSFDDMATAVNKVPRNITVTANTNPALQALAELNSKLSQQASKSYGGGTITAPKYIPQKTAYRRSYLVGADVGITTRALQHSNPDNDLINGHYLYVPTSGFRAGGYTGDGNPWDVAGDVHKREFVLNEVGAQMLPMSVLNAMNQGRAPQSTTVFAPASGSGVMELGPKSLGVMRQIVAKEVSVQIGDTAIGQANDRYNAGKAGSGR